MHPCLACGACCAYFRVSFHWSETLAESLAVPPEATVAMSHHHLAMRGTEIVPPRCVALVGEIGELVYCSIYSSRPSSCRDFTASYENGEPNARCDQARVAKGLAALQPSDWSSRPTNEPSDFVLQNSNCLSSKTC